MSHSNKNKIIECYQIIEIIGKGGNGLVYKGINLNNGTFVAMKEMSISKEEIKAIKKEIHFIKNLNHHNIVKYFDAVIKDHKIYLILEYIEGGSLGTLCKRTIFPESLIKLYILQILEGLDYLHKQNIVHRDIKGLNVLLTKEGKIKIADFGVAVNINQNQRTLSTGGTPYWMAPETANGQDYISTKCDVWSLGCTVIELITGNPPYSELNPLPALIRIVQDQHPPLPKNSTPQCIDFLLKCFEKNPEKRSTAAELLDHKWIRTINEQDMLNQRNHKNQRTSNILLIQSTLKSKNLNEIYSLIAKTQNKKLVYFSKYFLILNEIENNELKLQIIYSLIESSFQTYKYLQQIGIIKNVFTRECKMVKINPLKTLDMIAECYRLGFQKDSFYMIQNNAIYYLSMICKQYMLKKEHYINHIAIIEKLCTLIKTFIYDQIILPSHLLKILQEENTLNCISIGYSHATDIKHTELSGILLRILNKYNEDNFQLQEALEIYESSFEKMCNIALFQNDIKTSQQNLKLIFFLCRYQEFQEKMQNTGFINSLSQYAKMLVLNKNICDDHAEAVLYYLQILHEFVNNKCERCRSFSKIGGLKRLKSLPKVLLQKGQIVSKVNMIITYITTNA